MEVSRKTQSNIEVIRWAGYDNEKVVAKQK